MFRFAVSHRIPHIFNNGFLRRQMRSVCRLLLEVKEELEHKDATINEQAPHTTHTTHAHTDAYGQHSHTSRKLTRAEIPVECLLGEICRPVRLCCSAS